MPRTTYPRRRRGHTGYRGIPARSQWATDAQIELIKRLAAERAIAEHEVDGLLKRTMYHELGDTRIPQDQVQPIINWLKSHTKLAKARW